jgi:hypothetical protein
MIPSDQANPSLPLSRAVLIAMLAASAAMAGFAISNQSYWIDEATSLIVAMAPDPAEAWKYANAVGGSTIQMPLYNIYLYAWHKMFGGGEWVMRAANIPFFVFAQLAFLLLLRARPRLALTACGLSLVCPTLWMYLDEARPYIMQYAAACWPTAALLRAAAPQPGEEHWKTSELLLLALGTILLAGSSLLGVLWAAGFVLVLLWLWKKPASDGPKKSPAVIYLAALAFPLLALGVFYFSTFESAGGGYFRPGTGLLSLPYVVYEFLGFSGFGPGRLELRTAPGAALRAHFFSLLPLAAVAGILGIFLWQFVRARRPGGRLVAAFVFAVLLPAAVTVIGMFFSDYRPLPRHFMPVLPSVILALAAMLPAALAQPSRVIRAAAVLLPLLWLTSSLNLRWREAHSKDDYRTAAAIAAAALRDNKEVWWAADAAAAFIYLTPVALEDVPGRAWAMQAPQWDDIRFKFPPRVIVISKPDIYDPAGAVARYAAENHFAPALKLHAFTIFTRANDPLPAVSP